MKKKLAILAVAAACIILIIFSINSYMKKTRNAVENLAREKKLVNVLIAGSNKYRERRHSFFCVLSINPDNNNIGITFIPPNFRVYLDESREDPVAISEVDFIYFDRLRRSLLHDLKLNIPFYVELYTSDVHRITDLIEGLDIFMLDQMKGKESVKFGSNYLDGKKVMRYINNVENGSIYLKFDRIEDIFLSLYHNRHKKQNLITFEFISELLSSIKTSLLPQEVMTMTGYFLKEGSLFSIMLPGAFNGGFYTIDNVSHKIYESEFLQHLIMNKEGETAVKVKILNGTSVPGLARKMRNKYNREGLSVVEFGTSPFPPMKKSVIIARKSSTGAVKKVSELTGIDNIHYIIDNTLLHNVLIIIGEDLAQ